MYCNNKFWFENPRQLFCNSNVVPLVDMSLEQQMNSLSRLVILFFILLLIIGTKISVPFLILSLLFIIILFYIQKKTMERFKTENYTNIKPQQSVTPLPCYNPNKGTNYRNSPIERTEPLFWCNDEKTIEVNNCNQRAQKSINQSLAGNANPKTLIPPVVTAPLADLNHWKTNNLINHSHINAASQHDTFLSGYDASNKCGDVDAYLTPIEPNANMSSNVGTNNCVIENYTQHPTQPMYSTPHSGLVNTECGYNPEQIFTSNLPSNLAAGNCQKDPSMKQYNKNIFTQNIQPDIYTTNQIIEPINSNIGISHTQQFPPTSSYRDENGLHYTEHDPYTFKEQKKCNREKRVTEADVYDPRFSGYGTSHRSYIDKVTGQPRFMYDDVDSVRMPNYISRSNIDFARYADSYGPLTNENKHGNPNHNEIRALAQDTFLRNTLQHRTELQERLMRKRNSELWQLRHAPSHTRNTTTFPRLGGNNMPR